MQIIPNGNKLITGSASDEIFQIGAPNVLPPKFVTLISGAGNNRISNCNGICALIKAGGGDNLIINTNDAVGTSIVCSSGNDSIVVSRGAQNTSIVTGTGNDSVELWSSAATIKFGGGNDLVQICADTELLLDVGTSDNYELKIFNGAKADITLTDGAGNYSVHGTAARI